MSLAVNAYTNQAGPRMCITTSGAIRIPWSPLLMLSHPPSGRVPAHCVVRVSLDARPLPPALSLRRPRGFLDPIVAFDYHAPYFRASRPYISIFSLASAKTPVDKYQNRPAPALLHYVSQPQAGGRSPSVACFKGKQ